MLYPSASPDWSALALPARKGSIWYCSCGEIGGMSPVMVTGAVLGQQKMTKPMAAAAAKLFGLSKTEEAMLNEVPMRGTGTPMPPTDPLIYRFYELVMVNGPAWKALIEEEFGDGIMSGDRLRLRHGAPGRPEGRPRQDRHDRQVPAVQVLRRDGQRAGAGV
jgi:cyanate lyase